MTKRLEDFVSQALGLFTRFLCCGIKALYQMNKILPILVFIMTMIMCGCKQDKKIMATDKVLIAENDSIEILYQVVDTAEGDIPEVAIWIKNKTTKQETKLYQTVRPDWHCWYMSDGNRFYPVPIDSILVTSRVRIFNNKPLQLIVEGCPDQRNEFSYFIDVPTRKAWYIPANQGYVGRTSEEGYMIFQSYRYYSDPDIGGRYTFLQIFDETGNMVDSLDLDQIHLRKAITENPSNEEVIFNSH